MWKLKHQTHSTAAVKYGFFSKDCVSLKKKKLLLDNIFILGENPAYEIKLTLCSLVSSKGGIKSHACNLNPVAIMWDIQATFWEAGKYSWIHRIGKVGKDL